MFYYAQKAVLHPTGPLYLQETQDVRNNQKKKNQLIILFTHFKAVHVSDGTILMLV